MALLNFLLCAEHLFLITSHWEQESWYRWIFPGIFLRWRDLHQTPLHIHSVMLHPANREGMLGVQLVSETWSCLVLQDNPPNFCLQGVDPRLTASGDHTRKNSVSLRLVTYVTEANHRLDSISIFLNLYWNVVDLQCYAGFCCIAK